MKKKYICIAMVCLILGSTSLTSCIGSFNLTNKVLTWNRNVDNKFVNELIFFAFWILPVYEVTSIADLLILNSIEFWSGNNPLEASVQTIDTDSGRYLVAADKDGYTITNETLGTTTRLNFDVPTQTWSVATAEGEKPLMTWLDTEHVKMYQPDGTASIVELSREGVMAYKESVQQNVNYRAESTF